MECPAICLILKKIFIFHSSRSPIFRFDQISIRVKGDWNMHPCRMHGVVGSTADTKQIIRKEQ